MEKDKIGPRRIDRLDYFASILGINDSQLTKETGLATGTLGKSRKPDKDLSLKTAAIVLERFPQLNRQWFLTGTGEMWTPPTEPTFSCYPLIDLTGNDGKNDSIATLLKARNLPSICMPGVPRETEFFIRGAGNSMLNPVDGDLSVSSGAYVGLSKLKATPIRWGELYTIFTSDGVQMRRFYPGSDDDHLRLVAYDREQYPDFEVRTADLLDFARVTCIITMQIR